MKKILIVDNTPTGSRVYNKLNKYNRYKLVKVATLKHFKEEFARKSFDLCMTIVNDSNKDREEILKYITSKDKKQRVLEIQEGDIKCFFDKDCSMCKIYNVKSLYNPSSIESVISFIENYDETVCQFVVGQDNILDHLERLPIFLSINEDELEKIKSISKIKHFTKDSIIFYEGDRVNNFYLLIHGSIKQYGCKTNGNEIIYNQISAPSFISEVDSLKNDTFADTIEARTDCIIIFMEKKEFLDIIKRNPVLSFEIMNSLANNITMVKSNIYKSTVLEAFERIALEIYDDTNILQYKKKSELASDLNMASETLSRTLKTFKKLSILNDSFEVIDNEKLEGCVANIYLNKVGEELN